MRESKQFHTQLARSSAINCSMAPCIPLSQLKYCWAVCSRVFPRLLIVVLSEAPALARALTVARSPRTTAWPRGLVQSGAPCVSSDAPCKVSNMMASSKNRPVGGVAEFRPALRLCSMHRPGESPKIAVLGHVGSSNANRIPSTSTIATAR